MLQKLNLGTALGALVLFFLPWLDFQCSGKSIVTQTGIQTITGEASLSDELKSLGGEKPGRRSDGGDPKAPLVALALVAVVAAAVAALLSLGHGGGSRKNSAGVLCAVALGLLLLQMAIGFPAARKLEQELQSENQKGAAPGDEMGKALGAAMRVNLQTKHLPAFYIELALLALPTLVVANGLIDRMKKG